MGSKGKEGFQFQEVFKNSLNSNLPQDHRNGETLAGGGGKERSRSLLRLDCLSQRLDRGTSVSYNRFRDPVHRALLRARTTTHTSCSDFLKLFYKCNAVVEGGGGLDPPDAHAPETVVNWEKRALTAGWKGGGKRAVKRREKGEEKNQKRIERQEERERESGNMICAGGLKLGNEKWQLVLGKSNTVTSPQLQRNQNYGFRIH